MAVRNPLNIRFLRYIGPTTKHFINDKWRTIRNGSVVIADAADMNKEHIPVATRGKGFGFDARKNLLQPLPTALVRKLTGGYSGQLWVGGKEAAAVRQALQSGAGRSSFFAKEAAVRANRNPLRVNPVLNITDGGDLRINPREPFAGRSGLRVKHSRLLGGWFVVRGKYDTPISGRFDTKAEAIWWLRNGPYGYHGTPAQNYGRQSNPVLNITDGGDLRINPLRVNPRSETRDQLTKEEHRILARAARAQERSEDGVIEVVPQTEREYDLLAGLVRKGMIRPKRMYSRTDGGDVWTVYHLTGRGFYNGTGQSTPRRMGD